MRCITDWQAVDADARPRYILRIVDIQAEIVGALNTPVFPHPRTFKVFSCCYTAVHSHTYQPRFPAHLADQIVFERSICRFSPFNRGRLRRSFWLHRCPHSPTWRQMHSKSPHQSRMSGWIAAAGTSCAVKNHLVLRALSQLA